MGFRIRRENTDYRDPLERDLVDKKKVVRVRFNLRFQYEFLVIFLEIFAIKSLVAKLSNEQFCADFAPKFEVELINNGTLNFA